MTDIGSRHQETLDKILEAVELNLGVDYSTGPKYGLSCFYCPHPIRMNAVIIRIDAEYGGVKTTARYQLHEDCLRTMRKEKRKAAAPVRKREYATK